MDLAILSWDEDLTTLTDSRRSGCDAWQTLDKWTPRSVPPSGYDTFSVEVEALKTDGDILHTTQGSSNFYLNHFDATTSCFVAQVQFIGMKKVEKLKSI